MYTFFKYYPLPFTVNPIYQWRYFLLPLFSLPSTSVSSLLLSPCSAFLSRPHKHIPSFPPQQPRTLVTLSPRVTAWQQILQPNFVSRPKLYPSLFRLTIVKVLQLVLVPPLPEAVARSQEFESSIISIPTALLPHIDPI